MLNIQHPSSPSFLRTSNHRSHPYQAKMKRKGQAVDAKKEQIKKKREEDEEEEDVEEEEEHDEDDEDDGEYPVTCPSFHITSCASA